MKLFRICLLAAFSLAAIVPGMALASTITAISAVDFGDITDVAYTPGCTSGNVLGHPDTGCGKFLDDVPFGQSYISLETPAFTLDESSAADLNIFNIAIDEYGDPLTTNSDTAATIWVLVNSIFYNVGNTSVDATVASIPIGVSSSTTGWAVLGGTGGGSIDLDLFFGTGTVYGDVGNIAITQVIVASYLGLPDYSNGGAFSYPTPYGLDAIEAITPASVIPVPAAAWLFASGLIGLIAVGRKRIT